MFRKRGLRGWIKKGVAASGQAWTSALVMRFQVSNAQGTSMRHEREMFGLGMRNQESQEVSQHSSAQVCVAESV